MSQTNRWVFDLPRFAGDVAAFSEALGPENAAIVLPLAQVDWPDGDSRDEFIAALLGAGVDDGA